jgi:acyl carrier protein
MNREKGLAVSMTEQEILQGFGESVEQFVGVPAAQVTLEADLIDDLSIDSLSMVEVIVAVQEKFDVEVPDEDLKDLRSVQDVVSYVQRARRSGESA